MDGFECSAQLKADRQLARFLCHRHDDHQEPSARAIQWRLALHTS